MIRLATAADAASVATIQVSGWHAAYAGIMSDEHLAASRLKSECRSGLRF